MVRLGDGTVMRLYRQTVEDFGLYPGLELTDQQYADLRQAAGAMSAKMRAVRIVSAASVSAKDLEQRLIRKGEDPVQAKAAVNWMEDLSLIDDRQTARQVVDSCVRKGYGLARAKQALFEKRIPREYWQEALEDYPDQSDAVTNFLRNRLGDAWTDKDLKKAIDALIRRGHSYSAVRRALENLSVDTEEFPED
jgi:regulatory protein